MFGNDGLLVWCGDGWMDANLPRLPYSKLLHLTQIAAISASEKHEAKGKKERRKEIFPPSDSMQVMLYSIEQSTIRYGKAR